MHKRIIPIILILTTYLLICNIIYTNFSIENKTTINKPIAEKIETKKTEITKIINIIKDEQPIGHLIINKINLKQPLYNINSKENNIEKNVTILKYSEEPHINNSIMFIAAHSGTGPLAYFKNLDKLSIDDQLILEYKNIKYTYVITNIWETKKTGTITVPKEEQNQLVLTTCSPAKDNYQLIINSVLTKKES